MTNLKGLVTFPPSSSGSGISISGMIAVIEEEAGDPSVLLIGSKGKASDLAGERSAAERYCLRRWVDVAAKSRVWEVHVTADIVGARNEQELIEDIGA